MAQRNSDYERQPRDLYETPAWVTRVLAQHLLREPMLDNWPRRLIWEPAAGTGKRADGLRASGFSVCTSDIHDDGDLDVVGDFLELAPSREMRGIVTNPPYKLAEEFVRRALDLTKPVGGFVAMLLKIDFDSGKTRADMFRDCPAWGCKLVLLDRIVWFDAPSLPAGSPDGARKRPANSSPSENHAWFIWDWSRDRNAAPTIRYARNDMPKPISPREALRQRAASIPKLF